MHFEAREGAYAFEEFNLDDDAYLGRAPQPAPAVTGLMDGQVAKK